MAMKDEDEAMHTLKLTEEDLRNLLFAAQVAIDRYSEDAKAARELGNEARSTQHGYICIAEQFDRQISDLEPLIETMTMMEG